MNRAVISRRRFAGGLAAGAAALAAAGRTVFAAGRIPIGVQLYSVREDCAKDLAGVLAGVAKLGYQGVEFAGYHGRTAPELKKMLDDNGLKCAGSHIQLPAFLADELPRTIDFNLAIGNRYLIVPSLPEKYRGSIQAWTETAKMFNEIDEKLRPHKLRLGYHNHIPEFQKIDGQLPWDVFATNTNKDVILQFDIGHAVHAGADPAAAIRRYPGRFASVHVKEWDADNPAAVVGQGKIDWPGLLRLLEANGGTTWYIVEEESGKYKGLDGIKQCLENLRKMGK
jgi:sugar phosphate isomerase/epimerase